MISTGICRWLFLLISLSTWTRLVDSKEMRVVCYYTNWSVYRPGQAKFSPQNINPYLCTHLVYAFGGFTKENTLKPFDKYQDIEKGGYAKFIGLKTYNKNLKTLIAIGGWNEGSSRFSPMVASADRRKELVKNAIKFLRQNHFDGLDLDWEYPTFRDGGKSRDRDNYAQLVKELREEFERESEKTGRPRLLLTMAVPAGIEYINKGYDVPKLTKYLDWMNILSYDYHSAFEPAVNHHAPLYPLEEDNEYNFDGELNIDYTIKHYLKLGADPNKLILGIPTYGRSYTLFNPDAYEIGSPADGPGDMGEATRENGYLAYYEICDYIKNQDWEVEDPNPNAMGPIAFKDNQWVGYDDENIVRKKAEYVAQNGLGGIMFWAIDNDDFRGNCHGKPYPLIEAAKEALLNAYGLTEENLISPPSKPKKPSKTKNRNRSKTTTTTEVPEETSVAVKTTSRRRRIKNKSRDKEQSSPPAKRRKDSSRKSEGTSTYSSLKVITPAYTTPAPPATPDMGGAFKCEEDGFFPHPKDCKKYFWCLSGAGDTGIVAHQFTCPAGLYFNKAADSCDYSQNVLCNKKLQRATTTTAKSEEVASTEATTSAKPTLSSLFSTSRVPPKITAATSKTTVNFRTTTTTEVYEDEEYEDDEEAEEDDEPKSEEDPRVIKELINLIRKAGGIEELEKQLKLGSSSSASDSTTPSAISKTLYERVLSKTSKNALNALRKTSTNRNSGGPQGSGEVKEKEEKKVERGKPQYKTLTRQRSTTEKSNDSESEITEVKEENKERKSFRPKNALEYVNIRRPKASTTTEASDDDGFSRNKILGEDDDDEEEPEEITKKPNTPQYVNIKRQRPSTTESSGPTSKYSSIRRSTVSPIDVENDDDEDQKQNKIIRQRSSTESSVTADGHTSLRYQTIRRGTTTTPTSASPEEEDQLIRRRSTTESPTSDDADSKYSHTTQSSVLEETNESTTSPKYQTIARQTTTQPPLPSSEEPKQAENTEIADSESNITEGDLIATTLQEQTSNLSTESIVSSTHTEVTESNKIPESTVATETKKKRPVLFHPRPFASSAKPVPETTTLASKVSDDSNFKFRAKPTTQATRTRTRTRYSQINRNLNDDSEQEEKYERTLESKPVRTRSRVLVTTERNADLNEEYNRKYRPAELADLSSLTAVDLNLRGGEFVSQHRRRRPVTATTPATTERALEESEKTGSRTLTLARKAIDINSFGKSRRIPNTVDQLNESSDQTSTRKIGRVFRSSTTTTAPSTEESETSKATSRPRRIIRKFRPAASTSTTEEPPLPSSTSREIIRKRVPLFRARTTTPVSTSSQSTENSEVITTTTESPLLKLLKPRFEISKNDTSEDNNEDELLNEHTDVLSGEEGENIKLSESNIRESSQINSFDVGEKPLKKKLFDAKIAVPTSTESSRILRTRKIIRKLGNTTPYTETPEVASTSSDDNKKRRILRKFRPSTTANDLETSTRKHIFRSTTEAASPIQEEVTEEVRSRGFRPSFRRKASTTTESTKIKFSTPRYSLYSRPSSTSTTESIIEDNEEEYDEDEEENDKEFEDDDKDFSKEEEPKYTIYTTSSVERTHKFESNTNFNDEDMEDYDKDLKANKSIVTHVMKSALNSRKESQSIIDEDEKEEQENDAPSLVRQDVAVGKEEIQSQKDLLQTQTTDFPTTTEEIEDSKTPIAETTENLEISTLLLNDPTQENYDSITTNDVLLTTTEELKETTLNQITDDDSTVELTTDASNTEEPTKVNNITETTTEYRRRSTLRSIKNRPRIALGRRTTESSSSTTEASIGSSTRRSFKRKFDRNKIGGSSKTYVRSTSPLPLNKLLYRYSTTERHRFEPVDDDNDDKEEEDDDDEEEEVDDNDDEEIVDDKSTKPSFLRPSTTPRIVNKPVDTRKYKNSSNKPKYVTVSTTTESVVLEDINIDTEAIKEKNKNLFAKRKMNTPIVLPSTTASIDNVEVTTTTPAQTDSTDSSLTTLHHIFAEVVDGSETTTEAMLNLATATSSGKVERLIEVNRIVEVQTKEDPSNVKIIPTVDKIGEISRITLIKIVDGTNETIVKYPESNEIETTTSLRVPLEVAKVEEIPKVLQNVNLKNFQFDVKLDNRAHREERKFEIFGESKVANSKEQINLIPKPDIIDGLSHINVVTPKPLLVTEASTISLQGLFQTEKSHLNPSFATNDEVLETGRSEFVDVRVLEQDTNIRLDKGPRGLSKFIPVRVLNDEEDSTVKAHVMEISPKPNSRTIKIVPIQVAMSRSLANA